MNTSKREPRLWLEAALWMALLGPFFFFVYGSCNWISSQRGFVPSYYWEWERHIPFVPLLILPYMSIDLFFAGSTFLCKTRRELHTLVARILFAVAVSGICFLLFPLRFAFERPPVHGWLAPIFAVLRTNDMPFNLAPSLHISLRAILWGVYGRHLLGAMRRSTKTWFILIGLSTLLVWQHHLIDVITGFVMALITFYVFPDRDGIPSRAPVWKGCSQRGKLAAFYGGNAIVFGALGTLWLPGSALLYWPAAAFGLVAAGYAGIGPAVFQKNRGSLSAAAEWVLLPWLLLQAGCRSHWRTGEAYAKVDEGVWFGRRPSRREATGLLRNGVAAVLDLAAESTETRLLIEKTRYEQFSLLDMTSPSAETLSIAVARIRELSVTGTVYVHCELGYSRSAAVAAAWLLASGAATDVAEAVGQVRKARPVIRLQKDALVALEEFASSLRIPPKPAEILEEAIR